MTVYTPNDTVLSLVMPSFNPPAPKAGDTVSVNITATVCAPTDSETCYLGYDAKTNTDLYAYDRRITSVLVTSKAPPAWKPGDVVVLRHSPGAREYTYVRGQSQWPGEYGDPKYDVTVNNLYREGLVRHVFRGGAPVKG